MNVQEAKQETKIESLPQNITPGFGSLQSFELSLRTANLLSKSTLVPKEYQGQNGLPNCVIALNMASRMNADPLMVMQNLYIVNGKPGWSSQFLISTFNTSGRFSALRYEWVGKPGTDERGCRAYAYEKGSGEKLEGSFVTIEMAKKEGWYSKNGSKWPHMPDQMLMYRAAAFFIRAYAPELAMGMRTEEEIIDMTEDDNGAYEAKVKDDIAKNANSETIDIQPEQQPEQEQPKEKPAETNQQQTPSPSSDMEGPGF